MFEQFIDIDIRETTLSGLVETLRERRDFTDEGIEKMLLVASGVKGLGKPRPRIYLYPDITVGMEPLYDSEDL